ncbi:MAG TPA: YbaB/EbfC family nucleoid-associated protein [Myxococcota bacterium]|nr:YbaB/EbfC family nucleoid-associated protein [Myxococcota bacterium]
MSEPDVRALLARAQEMQSKLAAAQRDLARRTVEASSGGGMVTAVVSGELRVAALRIDPSLLATGDREMLQDLVAAAVNAAMARAQQMLQEEMGKIAGLPSLVGLGRTP